MRNLILITLLALSFTLHSQDSKIDWKSDLGYLSNELPKRHYDFDKLSNYSNFSSEINQISNLGKNFSDFEIAIKIQQSISKLGDSHTSINLGKYIDRNEILPLHLFWFKDGIFVLHTTEANKVILGQKIVKINGVSIETVVDSLSTILTLDNTAIVKSKIPKLIPIVQLLKFFGIVEDSEIELQLENQKGEINLFTIQPAHMDRSNRVMFKPDSLALCNRNTRANFIDYYQREDKIYYLQYNKCWSREAELINGKGKNLSKLPSFYDFMVKIFQTLKNQEIDKIVYDLTYNRGGNSSQGTVLIKNLAQYIKENPEKKIYVVVGRTTFSSAIINAMDFKNMTNAIFVGEETSGKPNHFGEVRSFNLPSSGLKVNYSTKYFQRVDDDLKTLTPDYIIETTFKDFKNGIDPVYEWIKKQ